MKPEAHLTKLWRFRQRRYRRRQRLGLRVCRVEVDEYALIEALIRAGRLTEDESLDPANVEAALTMVVSDFVDEMK